jgi:hypothetical protein
VDCGADSLDSLGDSANRQTQNRQVSFLCPLTNSEHLELTSGTTLDSVKNNVLGETTLVDCVNIEAGRHNLRLASPHSMTNIFENYDVIFDPMDNSFFDNWVNSPTDSGTGVVDERGLDRTGHAGIPDDMVQELQVAERVRVTAFCNSYSSKLL